MRGKRATVLEVTQLINRGKTIIVDVRSAEEFATGHLPDAKNIPLPELAKRLGELEKFKTRPIVVVCQKGSRSATAVGLLGKAGFAEATSLEGGLDEWKKQGLPLKTLSLANTAVCPYCVRAERLLEAKGVAVQKIRVDLDPEERIKMMERTGRRTVPQIYVGDTHVGGFDDLYALDQAGKLDPLLNGTAA
eukprot:gene18624-22287_t